MTNKPDKNLSLTERLKLFASRSTFHGVQGFIETKHLPIKIIHAISFMVSFCFCILTLWSNFNDFLSFRVKTEVGFHHDSNSDFATVTICEKQICVFNDYDYKKFIDFYFEDTYNQTGNLTEFVSFFVFVLKLIKV